VEVRVTDTGAGIPAEHLPRIFDRFYRVDPARSRHPEGTGLGLAIVKSIMELHGGSVTVQSEVGKGTSFTLRFPTQVPTAPVQAPSATRSH
jgi:signal transduction histidine kinase